MQHNTHPGTQWDRPWHTSSQPTMTGESHFGGGLGRNRCSPALGWALPHKHHCCQEEGEVRTVAAPTQPPLAARTASLKRSTPPLRFHPPPENGRAHSSAQGRAQLFSPTPLGSGGSGRAGRALRWSGQRVAAGVGMGVPTPRVPLDLCRCAPVLEDSLLDTFSKFLVNSLFTLSHTGHTLTHSHAHGRRVPHAHATCTATGRGAISWRLFFRRAALARTTHEATVRGGSACQSGTKHLFSGIIPKLSPCSYPRQQGVAWVSAQGQGQQQGQEQ